MHNQESRHDSTARIIREWSEMNAAARVKPKPSKTERARAILSRFGWVSLAFPPVAVAVLIFIHFEA